jgi:hypothetical protein
MKKRVNAFNPELLQLLLSAVTTERRIVADDTGPPTESERTSLNSFNLTPYQARTRWSILTFPTLAGVARWAELQRMQRELHFLRQALRAENDPRADDVDRITISMDTRLGALVLRPKSEDFANLLTRVQTATGDVVTPTAPRLDHDPAGE